MEHKENLKTIKKALAQKYGFKNVSVTNGSGTAWGWVNVSVKVEGDATGVEKEIKKIISDTGVKLYTYCDDMGGDNECLLVSAYGDKNAY